MSVNFASYSSKALAHLGGLTDFLPALVHVNVKSFYDTVNDTMRGVAGNGSTDDTAIMTYLAAMTNMTVVVPQGCNVKIIGDVEFDPSVTVIMQPGSKFTLAGTGTTLYIPNCVCLGKEHFVIGADCWVLFGSFESPKFTQFGGDGYANVRFNLGPELAPNRHFTAENGVGEWTLGSGWVS